MICSHYFAGETAPFDSNNSGIISYSGSWCLEGADNPPRHDGSCRFHARCRLHREAHLSLRGTSSFRQSSSQIAKTFRSSVSPLFLFLVEPPIFIVLTYSSPSRRLGLIAVAFGATCNTVIRHIGKRVSFLTLSFYHWAAHGVPITVAPETY
jgi:hypothetical protein